MVKLIERLVLESKDEWQQVRKGLFTASRINEIMADAKRLMTSEELAEWKAANPKSTAKYTEDETGISEGAETYILEIIQSLEGAPKPNFHSYSMDWGIETEPLAAVKYCEMYGYDLNEDDVIYTSQGGTVFFVGDNLLGCTPDLILADRVAQIKCPDSSTHLWYILNLTVENFKQHEPKYYDQVQLEMMLCQRDQCDFFSYDPRFEREVMRTFKLTIPADKERQDKIYRKALICEAEKQNLINKLPK